MKTVEVNIQACLPEYIIPLGYSAEIMLINTRRKFDLHQQRTIVSLGLIIRLSI